MKSEGNRPVLASPVHSVQCRPLSAAKSTRPSPRGTGNKNKNRNGNGQRRGASAGRGASARTQSTLAHTATESRGAQVAATSGTGEHVITHTPRPKNTEMHTDEDEGGPSHTRVRIPQHTREYVSEGPVKGEGTRVSSATQLGLAQPHN